MAEKESLKSLKSKAFHLYNQDGVIDIISGTVLFNFGLDLLNQNETTSIFTWVPILLISSIKDKITNQRISADQLGADKRSIRNWTFFPAVAMILALILFGTFILDDPFGIKHLTILPLPSDSLSLVGSLLLALACAVSGLTGLKRFFIYAAVALSAGLVSYFFLPNYFPFFLTAAAMLAMGIRLMVSFTKAYPLPKKDEPDEK